ncbi:MAG: ATP-binding protein [Saprospiraceae bacterium]|nr:ATP-binding protein [Saprospiraceae bacterium]
MNQIPRTILPKLRSKLFQGKALILMGARQTGKTSLVRKLVDEWQNDAIWLNADRPEVRRQLSNASLSTLKQLTGAAKLVVIDEAQRIKNIGLTLKLFTDEMPEVQVVATGSSAFELANEINEPLTGRKWEYSLYPISWAELEEAQSAIGAFEQLETRLIYGMYPEVINRLGEEREALLALSGSYLYKDVFEFQGVRKPEILWQLLQALALQLGSEVSYNELSQLLGVDKNTVSNYLDLLEKSYIVFRLMPLSRNLRNEINSNRKVYFYDNGIRNAVLENFSSLALRSDIGALWENFLVSERLKHRAYAGLHGKAYFWRTKTQQEIDYVEERDGEFNAWQFKWSAKAKSKFPEAFKEAYSPRTLETITPENFREFLS